LWKQDQCGELIDKYVEFDEIIVAINLVLQNPMAYRHVLLNSAFEVSWNIKHKNIFEMLSLMHNWFLVPGLLEIGSGLSLYRSLLLLVLPKGSWIWNHFVWLLRTGIKLLSSSPKNGFQFCDISLLYLLFVLCQISNFSGCCPSSIFLHDDNQRYLSQ